MESIKGWRIGLFGKKAQVYFDASVESSFHYEVEGDETKTYSGWAMWARTARSGTTVVLAALM